jgi:hypothetical protein
VTVDVHHLAEALPKEIKRVTLMKEQYATLMDMAGVNVRPAMAMMQASIDLAVEACAAGDTVAMLRAYADLRGFVD